MNKYANQLGHSDSKVKFNPFGVMLYEEHSSVACTRITDEFRTLKMKKTLLLRWTNR